MAADTLDVTTIALVKDMLGITGTDQDDELQRVVTGVSRKLDDLCGPIVNRTITDERHRRPQSHRIKLRKSPVSSVTTVVTWVSGTDTTLTAETDSTAGDYRLEADWQHAPWLVRRSSWSDRNWTLSGDVLVTYVAGRAANTAAVDDLFVEAAHLMVAHLFKTTGPSWHTTQDFFDAGQDAFMPSAPRFGVPNAVLEMLAQEIRPPAVV